MKMIDGQWYIRGVVCCWISKVIWVACFYFGFKR